MTTFEKQFKETDRLLKELAVRVNDVIDVLGIFIENKIKPSMGRIFAERGIQLTGFMSQATQILNGKSLEIDVLGYGPHHIIAVEVKLELEQNDVKNFLHTLDQFFDFFDIYRDLTLYGAGQA
ncbi:MAG: hypothetical protein D6813_02600 [Calditrichaeota bacterium]|nr:MAG: hypothetical protein D6813_02600 [Calditrichota bacterium]